MRRMASSTTCWSWPRRSSLRRSSSREWSRRPRSLSPVSNASAGCGVLDLELLCRTCGSPHCGGARLDRRYASCGLLSHPGLDLGGKRGVLAKVVSDVLTALAEPLVAEGHPRPAFLEDQVLECGVDERALS